MTIQILIFVSLVDSILIYVSLHELLESLTTFSTSSSDSEDLFLTFSLFERMNKYSYTTYHIKLCIGVESVFPTNASLLIQC